jgi:3-hydroxybutyrate dehydrogenase
MKKVTALMISSLNSRTENLVQKFTKQGWNMVVNGDQIQKEKDIQNFVEQILNQFQHIDVLIINNQCRRHYRASIEEFPSEKWRDIIDANLISTFTLIKTLWPHMKRQHFGRIIHLVSIRNNLQRIHFSILGK